MNEDGATKSLAKFAAELEFNKIPENILNYLKLLFLDGIGCCIHGNTLEWTKILEEVVTTQKEDLALLVQRLALLEKASQDKLTWASQFSDYLQSNINTK